MPLASSEEMISNETIVSVDGDRVYDLVREGNFYVQIFKQLVDVLVSWIYKIYV